MKRIFLPAAALCLAFTSIKPATDYRDAYVGSYFCNRNCLRITTDHLYLNVADTMTIRISKDATDSIMDVVLGSDTIRAKLLSGYLVSYPDESNYGGNFFSTDSLNLDVFYGKTVNCNYRGKKK